MKAYLLIGSSFLPEDEERLSKVYFRNKNTVSNALYEKKLISGFLKIIDGQDFFCFLSAPSVGWWPSRSKKIWVRGFSNNSYFKSVDYYAFWRLTNLFKSIAIKRRIKSLIKNELDRYNEIHVIACEAYKPYLNGIKFIKKRFTGDVFSTLVVPDLPQNIISSKNLLYKFLKKINVNQIYSLSNKYIDSYLCFTNTINISINQLNRPYIIREGIIDLKENHDANKIIRSDDMIHCVFMGKIDKRNGLDIIINAAKIAPDNMVFDIYGPFHDEVLSSVKSTPNLIFHGYVSPSEVGSILEQSDVLLSTRIPEGNAINSSFPSKVFEYISYKKPIVTYKLPCYFQELDGILNYPKDTSAESLIECIISSIQNHNGKIDRINALIKKYDSKSIASSIVKLNQN